MSTPILWYLADPMCSWCWGFSPTIEVLRDAYRNRMKIALVLGGLRPGETTPMTPAAREDTLHHWHDVHTRTAQPFQFEGALPEGFVYNTEPASRAVVAVSSIEPNLIFQDSSASKSSGTAIWASARQSATGLVSPT